MKNDNKVKAIVIYSGSPWEAGLVKSMLEDAGIMTFLKDEAMGSIAPFDVIPGGAGAVKVVIADKDEERAAEIISGIKFS